MTLFRKAQTGNYKGIHLISSNLGCKSLLDEMAQRALDILLKSKAGQIWLAIKDDKVIAWIHVFIARRLASAPICEMGGQCTRCNTRREEAGAFYESIGLSNIKQQNVFEIKP